MSRLLPFRSDVESATDREPRIVDIDEDAAEDVFTALSSGTTRSIFTSLYESPKTAGDLAEATDTTIQNIHYHLDKLQDSDLVEVVDTWYSEKGREMNVYAPADSSVVLFTSDEADKSTVRRLFKQLLGVLSLVALAGLLARAGFEILNVFSTLGGGGMDSGGPGTPPPKPLSSGVEVFAPEFLVVWAVVAVALGYLWWRWT